MPVATYRRLIRKVIAKPSAVARLKFDRADRRRAAHARHVDDARLDAGTPDNGRNLIGKIGHVAVASRVEGDLLLVDHGDFVSIESPHGMWLIGGLHARARQQATSQRRPGNYGDSLGLAQRDHFPLFLAVDHIAHAAQAEAGDFDAGTTEIGVLHGV